MYRLTIVALPGCEACEGLTNTLTSHGMPYKLVNANDNDSLCDMLETLLQSKSYPMAVFEIPSRSYFVCMPNTTERVGWKYLDETSTSIGVVSTTEIANTLIDLKNRYDALQNSDPGKA